jgi:hypothetical protein
MDPDASGDVSAMALFDDAVSVAAMCVGSEGMVTVLPSVRVQVWKSLLG